ncbi:hypothetical protein [Alteribacter aurantiacus]|uniref:hypothetical protein n=1 Tax=Alteribacter aurantiacus TaxID=254410 RepID=UPI0003F75F67|nr:hypothetical protein [Alteribacter aurantiacus]
MLEHKKIKQGLAEIDSEQELELNTASLSLLFFVLAFNFLRRWLFYILASLLTGSFFIAIISLILFVVGLYDSIFNYRLANVKKSQMGLYLAIADTIFIVGIMVYYLFF